MAELAVSPETIRQIEVLLCERLGWKFEMDKEVSDMQIARVCRELEEESPEECLRSIKNRPNDPGVIRALAREFSVGESYFFRDRDFFDQLEQCIIPRLLEKNSRSVSVWSVGCSRGEELYSIALVLRQRVPEIGKWDNCLLGTDVNPDALERAEQGLFDEWSLRQIPERYAPFFAPQGSLYAIDPAIRKMARFQYHNIASDPIPPSEAGGRRFDLILLNNILIYFEPEKAKRVARSLFSLVKEGGWLATTPAEYGMEVFDFPHVRCFPKGYLLQKVSEDPAPQPVGFPASGPEIPSGGSREESLAGVPHAESAGERVRPHQPGSYYRDALAMLEEGENEQAKAALRRVLYLEPENVMAHIVLGNLLDKEGKTQRGVKHLYRARALLQRMAPEEEVELSGGMRASDLLSLLNSIKGGTFG